MRTGFWNEDYELARAIQELTGVMIRPSQVCDIAAKWAAVKIAKMAHEIDSLPLRNREENILRTAAADVAYGFATRLEAGEV